MAMTDVSQVLPGMVPISISSADADGRIPAYSVRVNGKVVSTELNKGYLCIQRRWRKGDRVEMHLEMQPRLITANEKVEADKGRVAVERGPLVYCAEWPENPFDFNGMLVSQKPRFNENQHEIEVAGTDMKATVTSLTTDAQVLKFDQWGRLETQDVNLKLIPYYAWNHRGPGRMMVWLPWKLNLVTPTQP